MDKSECNQQPEFQIFIQQMSENEHQNEIQGKDCQWWTEGDAGFPVESHVFLRRYMEKKGHGSQNAENHQESKFK